MTDTTFYRAEPELAILPVQASLLIIILAKLFDELNVQTL